ncbi:creatininase family protein [Thalassospira alkalitolerans]|uniref:creatininase family protein n=1 Tax=Thalassospira alkalitolerans TaxID=1293890 RepID=UPI0030EBC6FF|tara:strand:+ start:105817 stop:106632 length:816 start_codon:yes stop_codon:yes gene_type:complete
MTAENAARKHLLKDMTFIEFKDRLEEDPVIIISLGSQEEQGPAAPMGDYMLTDVLSGRIAEKSGAIAAPIMPFGYADYFRTVPGGMQLRPETFCSILTDMIENFTDHGISKIIVLNGHSGNYPLIDQVIRKMKREKGLLIPCLNLWRLIPADMWQELHPELGMKAFGHGGDPLTSVYLHLFPELMRMDLLSSEDKKGEMLGLPTAGLAGIRFQGNEVALAVDVTDRCANGVAGGEPAQSSAEKGEKIVDYLVGYCADFVSHFSKQNPKIAA